MRTKIHWHKFALFLTTLEEKGFVSDPEQHERILQIAQHCHERTDLQFRLSALLCKSKQEQDQFAAWFEQVLNLEEDYVSETHTTQNLIGNNPHIHQEGEFQENIERGSTNTNLPWGISIRIPDSRVLLNLLGVTIFLALVLLCFYFGYLLLLLYSILSVAVIFLVFNFLNRSQRKEEDRFTLRQESINQPIGFFNINDSKYREIRFNRAFQGIAKRLRERHSSSQKIIDIKSTIRKSIEKVGFFEPQFIYQSKAASYLLLIDQGAVTNLRFHLAEELFKWMHNEQGLDVVRFWYRQNPQNCWNESHPFGISIEELPQLYAESRLLIFGDGWQLINPLSQKLLRWVNVFSKWNNRTIITPVAPPIWTQKEAQLSQLFVVVPASVEGLRYWSKTLIQSVPLPKWKEKAVHISAENFLHDLRTQFPDPALREWLCALSCFPTLHWELTLRIGTQIMEKHRKFQLNYGTIQRLTRLSWFFNGFIPEEMRKLLYEQLNVETAKKIHASIATMMHKQLEDDSISHFSLLSDELELQIAIQKIAAGMMRVKDLTGIELRKIIQSSKKDFLVLKLLRAPYDPRVPQRLVDLIYKLQITINSTKEKIETPFRPSERPDRGIRDSLTNTNFITPIMIRVIGGAFKFDGKHSVGVETFSISQTPITFEMYDSFCLSNNFDLPYDNGWGRGRMPVINIDWYDSIEYCNWLSKIQNLTELYTIDKTRKDPYNMNSQDDKKWIVTLNRAASGYRLPTEAEWEYSAKGGNNSQGYLYAGSNLLDEVGWYWQNSGENKLSNNWDYSIIMNNNSRTNLVGQKLANEIGLYDMSGNVWEWCWDWYEDSTKKFQLHRPFGPESGNYRIVRGGSWIDNEKDCRLNHRHFHLPVHKKNTIGLRVLFQFASAF